jgi:predicted nucleic acid-binding protein
VILLDTVVLSELRKRRPNERVVTWMRGLRESEVFVSVISIGEIERGIAKADDPAFAAALDSWLARLLHLYADRILPVSAEVARRWGRLSAELGHDGADVLIAATAACHGLTVATRNTRHFRATGVPVIDPFVSS